MEFPIFRDFFVTSSNAIGVDGKELDVFLKFLLQRLRDLYPHVSRELTKRADSRKGMTSLDRKKCKILLLLENHRPVFDELGAELNRAFGSPHNPLGYSSSAFFNSVYHLVTNIPVSGSYGIKYGAGQGPTEG